MRALVYAVICAVVAVVYVAISLVDVESAKAAMPAFSVVAGLLMGLCYVDIRRSA